MGGLVDTSYAISSISVKSKKQKVQPGTAALIPGFVSGRVGELKNERELEDSFDFSEPDKNFDNRFKPNDVEIKINPKPGYFSTANQQEFDFTDKISALNFENYAKESGQRSKTPWIT